MGTLVKRHLGAQWGLQPEQIYHCAIMPCYDKKLEASREDFNVPGTCLAAPLSCNCAFSQVYIYISVMS